MSINDVSLDTAPSLDGPHPMVLAAGELPSDSGTFELSTWRIMLAGWRASPAWHSVTPGLLLEIVELVVVGLVFGHFVYNMLLSLEAAPNLVTVLLVLSEMLAIGLIVAHRRSGTISTRPTDWLLAFAGMIAPLLVVPVTKDAIAPVLLCAGLMLCGLCVQISAKVMLGRSFGIVAANRGVKVLGPYRFVRHPMYAGYVITHVGFLMGMPSWRNATVYACGLAIQIARLLREERILLWDPAYRDYAARVRYRLLPGIF
ncbi:MAG: isoprenylcysteine carboxylmethyltransferase family protein [Rhodopseudomonas sp.]|nr:isoprenylcysteine carboxylmethyltransferase family protein [Rhodopseudomonas sp.]